MKPPHFRSWQLRLMPLTTIHVGSGTTLDPTEYYFQHGRQTSKLIAFDQARLLQQLNPQERLVFRGLVDRLDLKDLGRWLRDRAQQNPDLRRFSIALNTDVAQSLESHFDDPRRSGEIDLFTRDLRTGLPYIPGSAVKGAIRTAIIAELAGRSPSQSKLTQAARESRSGAEFESHVLGNRNIARGRESIVQGRDPFRQLAIADLSLPDDSTIIDRVQIVRLNQRKGSDDNDPSGIQIYREVTRCPLLGLDDPFVGEIRIQERLAKEELPIQLSVDDICRDCNAFYRPRFERETKDFNRAPQASDWLEKQIRQFQANECLIRMGRHSHVECVTLGPKWSKNSRGGRSRTYLQGTLPLGWAKLTFDPVD